VSGNPKGLSTWAWHLGDGPSTTLRTSLGSVRQLADGSGEACPEPCRRVTLAQGYTPFGVLLWSEGSGTSGYGYTGEQEDATVGLVFLRARYYDPYLARFISKDTWPGNVWAPGTLNKFVYSLNNPVNLVDPLGFNGGILEGILEWGSVVLPALSLVIDVPALAVTTVLAAPIILLVASSLAPDHPVDRPLPPYHPAPPPVLPREEPRLGPPPPLGPFYPDTASEPDPYMEPAPRPAPQPARPDPIVPPCPKETPEPKWHLYHYTTDAGLAGILATKEIWPSIRDPKDPKSDAQWGDGQYFTDISPQDASVGSAYQLSRALYNIPWKNARVKNWVKVNVTGLAVGRVASVFSRTYGDKSIYLHRSRSPLNLASRIDDWGPTPFAR